LIQKGFPILSDAQNYCASNPSETCCTMVSSSSSSAPLSSSIASFFATPSHLIIVFIISAILLGVLIGLCCFCHHRKQRSKVGGILFNGNKSKSKKNPSDLYKNEWSSGIENGYSSPYANNMNSNSNSNSNSTRYDNSSSSSSSQSSPPQPQLQQQQQQPGEIGTEGWFGYFASKLGFGSNNKTKLQDNDHPNSLPATNDHDPTQDDEIEIRIGDRILIEQRFEDGWCVGHNLTSNQRGAFPLLCIETENYNRPRNQRVQSMYYG